MKQFMDEDFLLSTETARELYHSYAKGLPIIDYHCHISPREIYEDRDFENIAQLWLEGDHYKWRLMRFNGVEERYITGDAPDWEKFQKWVETLELAAGNPLYHWSHLELKRYFGYDGILNRETAPKVWEICNEKLRQPGMTARSLIENSNVELLCTTDDPVDSLEWHRRLAQEGEFKVRVLPAFRPDRAIALEKPDWKDYLEKLGQAAGIVIKDFAGLVEALERRMDFFGEMGCKLADHGLAYVIYEPMGLGETAWLDGIIEKRLGGREVTLQEERGYKTALLTALGRAYAKRDWAMQLHYSVKRDNNARIFAQVGPDAGIDCIRTGAPSWETADFLNGLESTGELPRTILYSLNPADNAAICSIIGCFQEAGITGKVQQGSAWWFNDHRAGITEQLSNLASQGLLSVFIGMLTDSRSLLSYTRHEYFRRILCDYLGNLVEQGEYPRQENALRTLVERICYKNALEYFKF